MAHCQTLIQNLRQRGYRITPQREMIIEALAHSEDHMSAEEMFGQVRSRTRSINLATVYRTLELLVEEGFACRNDLGAARVVYATNQHGPHVHMVCRQCGCVTDADVELLEPLHKRFEEHYGFEADLQHISITGICAVCQTRASS